MRCDEELPAAERVGWVELFAKPISKRELMGIASLHPSYELIDNGDIRRQIAN